MSCERYENLLPAFLDGDLPSGEDAALNAHLSGCESCQASLAAYRALEDELVLRREIVPPVAPFLSAAFAPAVSPALHRARVLMDRIFGLPSLATFAFFVLGWVLYSYSNVVQGWLDRITGATPAAGRFAGWLSELSAAVSGGDMMVIALAYTGVTLLILGSGTWMTLRFVQSD
jgi:anti-sigma factor RsiW